MITAIDCKFTFSFYDRFVSRQFLGAACGSSYRMDRNFRGTKLSRLQKFEDFRGLNFRGCQL